MPKNGQIVDFTRQGEGGFGPRTIGEDRNGEIETFSRFSMILFGGNSVQCFDVGNEYVNADKMELVGK
jgi:hypothetical protein